MRVSRNPTFAEAGLPDVEASGRSGFFVPAGTPKPVIDISPPISPIQLPRALKDKWASPSRG
ncbi:MAG: hypothetical protein M3Y55_09020 [Pseudomonadota bacterium]|nr:hypothetical protein [Pseudomonadota bacterium]